MNWASKIKAHGAKQARSRAPAKPRSTVEEFYFQIRKAGDNDPGEVSPAYFIVEDGKVTLTDRKGEPLGKPVSLNGHTPKSVACVLAQQKWKKDGGDFNRRLSYPPCSTA